MKAVAAIAAIFLAGCVSSPVMGPNGRAMHHIEAVTTAKAYAKAAESCPRGYNVLHARQQGLFHVLDIECK